MTEQTNNQEQKGTEEKKSSAGQTRGRGGERRAGGGGRRQGGERRGRRGAREEKPAEEFEQRVIDIARVTRVMAGGKRMRFRACVAIGDKKGRVAIGLAKGADVTIAVSKAVNQAKKDIVNVSVSGHTIPHAVDHRFGAAHILLKPAAAGRGIIAGGIVRTILELSGVHNVSSKILGTNNKVNNAKCVMEALKSLKAPRKSKSDKNQEGKENKGEIDEGNKQAEKTVSDKSDKSNKKSEKIESKVE